jgi:hypothetical protein
VQRADVKLPKSKEEVKAMKSRILHALVVLVAKELRPINLAESEGMTLLAKAIDPDAALPCNETLIKAAHLQYADVLQTVPVALSCCLPAHIYLIGYQATFECSFGSFNARQLDFDRR